MAVREAEGPIEGRIVCQLSDWELVSTFESALNREALGGTPGFWSPEQVVPLPAYSEAKALARHALESCAVDAYWRAVCLDPPPLPPAPECISAASDSWGLGTLLLALGMGESHHLSENRCCVARLLCTFSPPVLSCAILLFFFGAILLFFLCHPPLPGASLLAMIFTLLRWTLLH